MMLLLIFAPLAAGLCCLITGRGFRLVPFFAYVFSFVISTAVLVSGYAQELELGDRFGVSLLLDPASAWFILLNAAVSMGVAWHERYRNRHHYFFILLVLLHGCINACFVSTDLFNLYVVIELATIIAFLLISQGMTTGHLWNALRYIFLSNVGMLFYLLGVLWVYQVSGSFSYTGVVDAPPTARALIMVGLLVKGGVFVPGLWLPQAHSEADAAVSALLSGVVVNIGLLPLIRLEVFSSDLEVMLRVVGFGGIFMGLGLALFQRDIKRLLACSTISQVGFVLITPVAGPMYAFAHGLAKAVLFLCAGNLPDRNLCTLKETRMEWSLVWPMRLAALSIAGCPLFVGFSAKYAVAAPFSGWSQWIVIAGSVGTAAILAPVIFVPGGAERMNRSPGRNALILMGSGLMIPGLLFGPYTWAAVFKSIAILGLGCILHYVLLHRFRRVILPAGWEKLEHVVGMICLTTVMLIVGIYAL